MDDFFSLNAKFLQRAPHAEFVKFILECALLSAGLEFFYDLHCRDSIGRQMDNLFYRSDNEAREMDMRLADSCFSEASLGTIESCEFELDQKNTKGELEDYYLTENEIGDRRRPHLLKSVLVSKSRNLRKKSLKQRRKKRWMTRMGLKIHLQLLDVIT